MSRARPSGEADLSATGRFRPTNGAAPKVLAAAIVVLGAALSLGLNLPGHLSYDSVVQLAEGRARSYSGYHPLVMSWLLGLADAARPGAALFVVLDTALISGALLCLVLQGRRASWSAPLLAAAFVVSPQLLIYPAIVWKDVLFAAAATSGFAVLALAAAVWRWSGWRYGLLCAGLLLISLAALARQNGPVVLPFAAAAVGWSAARSGGGRRGWAFGLAFLGSGAAITLVASLALDSRTEGEPVLHEQWENLETWDIVGALSREPRLDLPLLRARAPALETLLRGEGVALYSPIRADTLEPILDRLGSSKAGAGLIAGQWRDLVLRHPFAYLRTRTRAFRWVFLAPAPLACVLVYTGVDGPTEEMRSLGLVRRKTRLDRALATYALWFAGTPVYSHLAYGVVGAVLLVLLIRRRRPADVAVAAMIASAGVFALTFAVISIACDYRYIYYLDLAVMAGALYTAATWRSEPGVEPGEQHLWQ